ncbi:hypothetical protein ACFYTS_21940 [Nocardia sp. NPDC004151]|uniref:hypothetical protein n=1 Tax=Nocardia sp. NPDC004151 TaxID=3364304 RepID=UPI0036CF7282
MKIEFVRQVLAAVGIAKAEQSQRWVVRLTETGDLEVPPRETVIISSVAQRAPWQNEYLTAKGVLADVPEPQRVSVPVIDTREVL